MLYDRAEDEQREIERQEKALSGPMPSFLLFLQNEGGPSVFE
jgi:hypothetical protein